MASHQQEENKKKKQDLTPEEIGQYRATAQQNSLDSISAAEERYAKAKESGHSALRETKEAVTHGVGAAKGFAVEKTKEGYHAAKDVAVKTVEKAKDQFAHHDKGEEDLDQKSSEAKEKLREQDEEEEEKVRYSSSEEEQSSVLGVILGAVGESLIEIAQTAKEIVMGRDPERKE